MKDFQNWLKFFDLKKKTSLHRGDFKKGSKKGKNDVLEQGLVSINFRMPETLRSTIEQDLRLLADNSEKISLNDYLLLLIMVGGSYRQNDKGKFYVEQNAGLKKHVEQKEKDRN